MIAAALAGCAMMESSPIDVSGPVGCASDAGAYYLAKTNLEVVVARYRLETVAAEGQKTKPKTIGRFVQLDSVTEKRKPDHDFGYCLDYVASPTADDRISVEKTANYLLKQVSTQAIDQSAYILTNVINAVFTGIASQAGRNFRSGGVPKKEGIAFRAEYDPFDPDQSAVVNKRLSDLGFCLILETHTFDLSATSVESYCNDPRPPRVAAWTPRSSHGDPYKLGGARADARRGFRQPSQKGILYRPRLPYNYYLFVKRVEHGRVHWRLGSTAVVRLENISPIVSVGVDRSFFANRRTALVFQEGALQNVCVYKSSELEEIATIPLAIATNLSTLPTSIIQLRLENTNNHKQLVTAQERLIATQIQHMAVIRQTGQAQAEAATGASEGKGSPQYTAPAIYAGKAIKKETDNGIFPSDWDKICATGKLPTENEVITGNALISPSATGFGIAGAGP